MPHPDEVQAVVKAIKNCGRDIVLSLSPGDYIKVEHSQVYKEANMVRITSDIWDNRESIDATFQRWEEMQNYDGAKNQSWLDMDMICFGQLYVVDNGGWLCKFTPAQKRTFMLQRALAASPLIAGGVMYTMDNFSISLFTHPDILKCDQNGVVGKLVYRADKTDVWKTTENDNTDSGWIGIFNRDGKNEHAIQLSLKELGLDAGGDYSFRELWSQKDVPQSDAVSFTTETLRFQGLNGINTVASPNTISFISDSTANITYQRMIVTTGEDAETSNTGSLRTYGGASVGKKLWVGGDIKVMGSANIIGDLVVSGNTISFNTTTFEVQDSIIYLNANNSISNPDIGVSGRYNDGQHRHTGIFRDVSEDRWVVFKGYTPEPTTPIDIANASFEYSDFKANTYYGNSVFVTAYTTGTTTANTLIANNTISVGTSIAPNANGKRVSVYDATSGGGIQYSHVSGGGSVQAIANGGIAFSTYTGALGAENYQERYRLANTGNLLIGINVDNLKSKLQILMNEDSANTSSGLRIQTPNSAGGNTFPTYGAYIDAGQSYASSNSVYGVYSIAASSGGLNSFGLYSSATANTNNAGSIGVYAEATGASGATGALPSYTGKLLSGTSMPIGVYGKVISTGSTNTNNTAAALFENTSAYGATAYGIYIKTSSGPTTVTPLTINHAGTVVASVDSSGYWVGNIKAKIQRDSVTAVSASGATNIDLSLGNSFVVTMNATSTFSFTNPPSGTDITSFTIITVNSAGGYAISWPASVTWSGGQTPTRTTTSGKQDAYTFFTRDGGTTYVGSLAITNY